MKLCRFELKSSPGEPRSGMVYGGKIYETQGAEPVAVHEAADVRPLAPVQLAGSLRLFRTDLFPDPDDVDGIGFFYSNPAAIVGPSQFVNFPEFCGELSFETYLAAVVVEPGYRLDIEDAEDIVLGLTAMTVLVARDEERRQGRPGGRTHDIAACIGPVLTTPDEIEDAVIDSTTGRRHQMAVTVRVNGIEFGQGNLADLPCSLAQAIAFASQSCTLRSGDVVGVGPLVPIDESVVLHPGDEVQLAIERLGTLSTKITPAS